GRDADQRGLPPCRPHPGDAPALTGMTSCTSTVTSTPPLCATTEDEPMTKTPDPGPLPPDAFHRWYGGWDPLDPTSIIAFMHGFARPWWIIGGWSIEKWTGISRPHEDMDISIFGSDAEAFRLFLGEEWTPWNMDRTWLRPFDHRFRELRIPSSIWVRRNAQSP